MKVAVYFAQGYEEVEALAVVDILRRAEIEVTMVGVTGEYVKSARSVNIQMDTVIEKLDTKNIDMIILPGGVQGVNVLEKNELVIKHLHDFKQQNKWIGAICAAPSILGKEGLLKGEKATCYPGYEKYFKEAEYVNQNTVISNKIITSRSVGTALEFAIKIVSIVKGEEIAKNIQKAIIL